MLGRHRLTTTFPQFRQDGARTGTGRYLVKRDAAKPPLRPRSGAESRAASEVIALRRARSRLPATPEAMAPTLLDCALRTAPAATPPSGWSGRGRPIVEQPVVFFGSERPGAVAPDLGGFLWVLADGSGAI